MRQSTFLRAAFACFAFTLALALTATVAQAQTGKLAGVVTDKADGKPIEGAQVVLQGTGFGGATAANGRYFMLGLPPGTYTVLVRRIGFQTQQTQISISIDVTRELNFQLSSATTTLAAVQIVETATNLVELRQSGNTTQITAEELATLPVRSIRDALNLQAGFTEIPAVSTDLTSFTASRTNSTPGIVIRGGRAGETMFLIDDIPVNNFLFGNQTLDITNKAVQSISSNIGFMEPQYGNALSGTISTATREGGATLQGALTYESSRFGELFDATQDRLRNYNFVEGFISGPVPLTNDKLRFVVSGRMQAQAARVLEYDDQIFNPFQADTVRRLPQSQDLFSGWRATGVSGNRDVFGKLTYLFGPTTKLSLGALHYYRNASNVPFDWGLTGYSQSDQCVNAYQARYGQFLNVADVCNTMYGKDRVTPLGRPAGAERFAFVNPGVQTQLRNLYTARFEQTKGRLNYKIVGGMLYQKRQSCATFFSGICMEDRIADTNFDGRFVTPGVTSVDRTPTEGTDELGGFDRVNTSLLRADAQFQATDHHNLAAGIFYQRHDILFHQARDVGLNDVSLRFSDYGGKPWDAAAYIQDRIEYDFLTIRVGARYDYGRAGGQAWVNPLDPTNGTTSLHVCNDPTRFGLPANWATAIDPKTGNTVTGLTACGVSGPLGDSARDIAFRDDMGSASLRRAFSPRLGVNLPITEKSSAMFNFGVYYQNPLYNNVYQNTGIGTRNEGTRFGPTLDAQGVVGNPNLRAEQTVSYEIGYQSEF
ncbi:MAG: carboxypeptidase-like regulatory domain-containing protein, partial [Gemmatimonadaceae bacterium]|nr:carboxypeptidase-like regulatory domain-containing protein [Gemmatimonadaceae bacterium]